MSCFSATFLKFTQAQSMEKVVEMLVYYKKTFSQSIYS